MAISAGTLLRPLVTTDPRSRPSLRKSGLLLILVGLGIAMVAFISNIVEAGRDASAASIAVQAAWTFGVATVALGTIKSGIALILWGIVRQLWTRVRSVKEALPRLVPQDKKSSQATERHITTPFGSGRVTRKAPSALPIHRMAYALWAPMLIMGAMLVAAGLVLSFLQAASDSGSDTFQSLRALVPATMFLGEGFLLSGISFLLGSILGSIRQGGGEVQESLGVGVKTLRMPLTAKLFVGLMMTGLMVEMVQFGFYVYVSTLSDVSTINAYLTWLGPLREAGLGILLSGIVLALGTIGKILGFQFYRLRELITTGQ
ncbi:MAG: hypothetical protein V3S37_05990 [Dehalococcoidia bacterium]